MLNYVIRLEVFLLKISILCKYPLIHYGIKSILKEKYKNITSFFLIDDFLKYISTCKNDISNGNVILITVLLEENLEFLDKILSVKAFKPNLKLLIIDFNESKDIFLKLSNLNIDGYILGTFTQEDITYAIHKISTGFKFYDREFFYKLVESETALTLTGQNSNKNNLTKREIEILSQLSKGLSNLEIAKNLNISENTVKKHISNIFIKINVNDRTKAIIYAYEYGIIF